MFYEAENQDFIPFDAEDILDIPREARSDGGDTGPSFAEPEADFPPTGPARSSRASGSSGDVDLRTDQTSWDDFAMRGSARSEAKRLKMMLPWGQRGHLSFPQPKLGGSLGTMLSIPELHLRALTEPLPSPGPSSTERFSRETISRVKGVRTQQSDEDMRNLGIKKLVSLLLVDPAATRLGRTIVREADIPIDEALIKQSVDHAFAGKASSTIYKRACSLVRYEYWQRSTYGYSSPFRTSEVEVYEYLTSLDSEGVGATAASNFVESLRFIDGVAKLIKCDLKEILSPRVVGLAHKLYLEKKPLLQKDPMPAHAIEKLEHLIIKKKDPVQAVILGQLIFCYHSGARWSDGSNLRKMDLQVQGSFSLLVGESLSSKTTRAKEAKTRFLCRSSLSEQACQGVIGARLGLMLGRSSLQTTRSRSCRASHAGVGIGRLSPWVHQRP